jgi:endo-1,4-beta-xylanase
MFRNKFRYYPVKVFQNSLIYFICLLLFNIKSFSQPLALGYDKFLGNVHSGSSTTPAHWDKYWNQVTPENAGKWGSVEGSRDNFAWGGADNAYNYAKQRGIPFKWHTLIWGQQAPGWISALSATEKLEEIVEWYSAVGQRYPEIDYIDVVNEPLNGHNPPDGGNGRANFKAALGGNGATGWDWVIKAFELARQYMPNSKLILNDYGIINDNNATTSYLQIINLLKQRGLIDGIGVQGHRFEFENASVGTLKNNLDRLAASGLPTFISEFDAAPGSTVNDATQLAEYKRIFPLLWEHPGVKGITLWGYISGQMWQTTAFLIRSDGTERPALQWLWEYLTKVGTFRSYQSGNWNDLNSWEYYSGSQWIHPAAGVPSITDYVIKIQEGHTITVTESASADQLFVFSGGSLIINPNVNFTVRDGFETDLTVYGTIKNYGTIIKDDSAVVEFTGGGSYFHEQDGGSIPIAAWENSSTIHFESIKTSAPSNLNQNFYNVVWNCPEQTSNLNLGWNGNTIGGNITIQNSGTGSIYICEPDAGTFAIVTINGDIIQSGGTFSTNGTNNGSTAITINHNGNINVSGGNFSISRGSQGGTGTTVWNLKNGNFTMNNAVMQNSNPDGAKFVFSKKGTQTLILGIGNTLTALPIEVMNGATLSMGTSELEGSGNFILDAGGTIETSLPEGIDGNLKNTGTITLSSEGGYNYSGTTAQVTGNLVPNLVNNMTVNNSAGVTLSKDVNVNGIMEIGKGIISSGGNKLTYGEEVTLKYSSKSSQTTTDVEFPDAHGPKNLFIENMSGVTLHAARAIPGNIVIDGKFKLGDYDFTAASASNTGRTRWVVMNGSGNLRLTSVGQSESIFPVGTSYYYAPVWVANSGDADIISVHLLDDAGTAPEGGRIKVKWDISEGTEGGGNYTLTFGWVTSLEDSPFKADRENNAFIFNLTDTTEAGAGPYTRQFDNLPYTVSRGGITKLGPFGVGKFGIVTGVEEKMDIIPDKFLLSQNYPNPFNPITVIKYSIPNRSKIRLVIYNILGMKVKMLIDSFQEKGEYSVLWDAKDEFNNAVSSGIYFYSLETNNEKIQKKMILLR